jgi:hypothetical protein
MDEGLHITMSLLTIEVVRAEDVLKDRVFVESS